MSALAYSTDRAGCVSHPTPTRRCTHVARENTARKTAVISVTVTVTVISRTALIRNRVSRRVLHVSKITWGILYLFQEAQTH